MTASFRDLLWEWTILFGWLSLILLGIGWHAGRTFRASLKAPLTHHLGGMPEWRERRANRWRAMGRASSWFSLLCFASWLLCGLNL
jgi:hypothetical protein